MKKFFLLNMLLVLPLSYSFSASDQIPVHHIVIAHRGASGYLPEHTLEAVAYAHAWNVDYVEPDVVLTKDDIPVIVHGVTIEEQTNVATLRPEKKRADGHWYVIDFTLAELKQLSVHEATEGESQQPQFPHRFPLYQSSFQLATLKEYLQLIKGLNQVTGKNVGIYLEPKQPEFHEQEGKDLLRAVFKVLHEEGYDGHKGKMIIQSFSSDSLKRIKKEWNPTYPLVQLISYPEDKDLISPEGLKIITTYAQAIGPDIRWAFEGINLQRPRPWSSPLIEEAHKLGLAVHGYTVRKETVPSMVKDFRDYHQLLFKEFQMDGIFSDFADESLNFIR